MDDDREVRRVYRVRARNFDVAVYVGGGRFIGVREKFTARYLDEESASVGEWTATDLVVPADIGLWISGDCYDAMTGRAVAYDRQKTMWFFRESLGASLDIRPTGICNQPLLKFMEAATTVYGGE